MSVVKFNPPGEFDGIIHYVAGNRIPREWAPSVVCHTYLIIDKYRDYDYDDLVTYLNATFDYYRIRFTARDVQQMEKRLQAMSAQDPHLCQNFISWIWGAWEEALPQLDPIMENVFRNCFGSV